MYSSYQIANFFIRASHKSGQELTPMKLIKLCYIAHGWHLAYYNEELLDEVVYAWKYGPVIDSVYQEFRHYRNSQITELYKGAPGSNGYPMPDEKIKPFLDAIWNAYGKYDGIALSSMTHQPNTPWDIVWNKNGGHSRKYAIIPNDLIKSHYIEKINQVNVQSAQPSTATT